MSSRHTASAPARWTGIILSTILGLLLLMDGSAKVARLPQVLEASAKLGYPPEVIRGIGIALVVSTLLYLYPGTAVLGAILLTGYLGGAVATHVRMGGPASFVCIAAAVGVLVWIALYLREPRLRALAPFRS